MRDLGRRPHRQLARGGERLDEEAARLDRVRDQPLLAISLLHGDVRAGELLVHLAGRQRPRVAAVGAELLVHEGRTLLERELGIDDDRQRLVLDLHQLGRVARGLAALRDDDRDAVADIARLIDRQRPMVRLLRVLGRQPRTRERGLPLAGELLARERGDHTAVGERARDVNAADPRVRVRTSHDAHPDHAGDAHIVHVLGLPGEESHVLLAIDRRANDLAQMDLGSSRHRQTSTSPAATCTARTMLW